MIFLTNIIQSLVRGSCLGCLVELLGVKGVWISVVSGNYLRYILDFLQDLNLSGSQSMDWD